ncbi:6-phosphogluconate dehydrogenase, decarboxylating [Raoultella terrigena]|uniref:6-phosphogluconate dehydrogenase, decarboxylating n=1 Tax=Raoultella terrigena TaxID=577 RepID=A0A4U9CWJ5_RAOTE|nr:6-phosphogluconate dehydrogenase, decarboxylating [Raoultella terrigena]
MSKQQIGVVGMAVMGRNLALNIESRGYTVSVSTVLVKRLRK